MTWTKVKLGDILRRKKTSVQLNDSEEYKLVTIKLHHKGVKLREIKKGAEIKSKMYLIQEGDFVLSGIDARNGAFGIVPNELDNAVVTNDFWCLEFDGTIIDKQFFLFLTSTEYFDHICKQSSDGTTQRIRLQKDKFFDYEIDLPSIPEQKKIVEKFNYSKVKINLIQEQVNIQFDLLKKLRQQILQDAIRGKLVPQNPDDEVASILLEKIKAEKEKLIKEGKIKKSKPLSPISEEEIPFDIPGNWVWCRFADIANIESKLVDPGKFPNLAHIAPNNIQKNTGKLLKYVTVSEDDVKSANHYFYPDQLIYSKVRPKLNKITLVDFEGLCSADMYPIKPLINAQYLKFCMLSGYFLSEVDKFDNRVKMPKINQNQLNSILIPIPPLNHQRYISNKISQMMDKCDDLESQLQVDYTNTENLLCSVLKEALKPKLNKKYVSTEEQALEMV